MKRKRRYYRTAALVGPKEQHIALRSKPRSIKIPWNLIVPLFAVIGLGLWVAFANTWYLLWDDLQVTGVYSAQMKRDIKMASDLLGWHRFRLRPGEAQEAIRTKMPQFSDVSVTCGLIPTSCTIAITERVPVLVWAEGSDLYWVDRTGRFYPAQGERPDLPMVRGARPSEGGAHSVVSIQQGIVALTTLGIPADVLEYIPNRGLIWTDPEGRRVAFGVGPEMAPRWQTYQVLLSHFAAKGLSPQAVDVRFPGGATYSLERSW